MAEEAKKSGDSSFSLRFRPDLEPNSIQRYEPLSPKKKMRQPADSSLDSMDFEDIIGHKGRLHDINDDLDELGGFLREKKAQNYHHVLTHAEVVSIMRKRDAHSFERNHGAILISPIETSRHGFKMPFKKDQGDMLKVIQNTDDQTSPLVGQDHQEVSHKMPVEFSSKISVGLIEAFGNTDRTYTNFSFQNFFEAQAPRDDPRIVDTEYQKNQFGHDSVARLPEGNCNSVGLKQQKGSSMDSCLFDQQVPVTTKKGQADELQHVLPDPSPINRKYLPMQAASIKPKLLGRSPF